MNRFHGAKLFGRGESLQGEIGMTWRYHEQQKDNAGFLRMFIAFLQSCIMQRTKLCCDNDDRPEFVPSFVRLEKPIVSDIPGRSSIRLEIGVHQVQSNQWGAISATSSKGEPLGIKPDECIVLEMRKNPYLTRKQEDCGHCHLEDAT